MTTTFTCEDFEMAAKAAGLDISEGVPTNHGILWFTRDGSRLARVFNPRDDDGDALRLAGSIGLRIDIIRDSALRGEASEIVVSGYVYRRVLSSILCKSRKHQEEAVRTAIFRAAIAIGRAMP
jgi:hypothetical protein